MSETVELVALAPIPNKVGEVHVGAMFRALPEDAKTLLDNGMARLAGDKHAARWGRLDWTGATVAIFASGPSLSVEQCEAVHAWKGDRTDRRVIAINTTFRRAPWADLVYACDEAWWKMHHAEVAETFQGERWTQNLDAKPRADVKIVTSRRGEGLATQPGVVFQGGNSGYQAIGLAYQAGAKRVILLGFDMQGGHWHGPHPRGLPNTGAHLFPTWIANFVKLARDLVENGVDVVNCTPGSALTAFPTSDLETELAR